jgi:hypothetical protein
VNRRHTAVEQAGGAMDVDMEDQEERALARAIRMGKMRLEIAGLEGKQIEIQSNNIQKRFEQTPSESSSGKMSVEQMTGSRFMSRITFQTLLLVQYLCCRHLASQMEGSGNSRMGRLHLWP